MTKEQKAWKDFCQEAIPHMEEMRRLSTKYGFSVISFWVRENSRIALEHYGDCNHDCLEIDNNYRLYEDCKIIDVIPAEESKSRKEEAEDETAKTTDAGPEETDC